MTSSQTVLYCLCDGKKGGEIMKTVRFANVVRLFGADVLLLGLFGRLASALAKKLSALAKALDGFAAELKGRAAALEKQR